MWKQEAGLCWQLIATPKRDIAPVSPQLAFSTRPVQCQVDTLSQPVFRAEKKNQRTNATSQHEFHPKLVSAPPEYPSLRCMKRICAARTLLRRQIFSNEHSIYRHCDYYLKDATFLPGDLVNSRAKQTLMIQSKTTHATYHWMSKNTKINTKSDIHWIQCNTSFCSYIYLNSAATFQVYKVYMCVTCYDTKFT